MRFWTERSWDTVRGNAARVPSSVCWLRIGARNGIGDLLSPETFLTKICMVSAETDSSGEADRDMVSVLEIGGDGGKLDEGVGRRQCRVMRWTGAGRVR